MFKSIPLRIKLLILSAIPFIAFLVLGGLFIIQNVQQVSLIKNQDRHLKFSAILDDLIYDVQNERSSSVNHIFGNGTSGELDGARDATDASLQQLRDNLDLPTFSQELLRQEIDTVSAIESLRGQVRPGSGNMDTVMDGYNRIVEALFRLNKATTTVKTTGGTGKRMSSLNIISLSQEMASRLAGYLGGIFGSDEPVDTDMLMELYREYDGIVLNLESPGLILSTEAEEQIETFLEGPQLAAMERAILTILEKQTRGGYGIDTARFRSDAGLMIETISGITQTERAVVMKQNQSIIDDFNRTFITVIALIGGAFLIILFVIILFTRSITGPVLNVAASLKGMAGGDGDLSVEIETTGSDEVAMLGRYFNSFTDTLSNLIGEIRNEAHMMEKLVADLVESMHSTETEQGKIEAAIENTSTLVKEQHGTVSDTSASLERLQTRIESLRSMIEDQTASVTESSASIEEMIANIQGVNKNVGETGDLIEQLVTSSSEGKEKIGIVTSAVQEIVNQSQMLQEANTLISNIASQTNLLAMNAAIEAAHAGEYGKGFAVVADEIRKLAENASNQSKGIALNLKSIQEVIRHVVESSEQAQESFISMNDLVNRVNHLQSEVKGAMAEQAAGSTQVLQALSHMNEITENIRDYSRDMGGDSQSVSEKIEKALKNSEASTNNMNQVFEWSRIIHDISMKMFSLGDENRESIRRLASKTDQFTLKE